MAGLTNMPKASVWKLSTTTKWYIQPNSWMVLKPLANWKLCHRLKLVDTQFTED